MATIADRIAETKFDIDETITPQTPPLSRMENLLMPSNFFDKVYAKSTKNAKTIKKVAQTFQQRRLGYHGVIAKDLQYDGTLDFSTDDGHTFSSPAINVTGASPVQIRLSLSQYQVQPLIRGWGLDWYLPTGWVWLDGLGTRTYEETNSNPTVITRVAQSPTNPQPVGFRVLIAQRYF